jgi:hypothetical protein
MMKERARVRVRDKVGSNKKWLDRIEANLGCH